MINKLCVESAEIIDMNTKYEENGITVTYVLECVENIAVFEPINVEYKNWHRGIKCSIISVKEL